MLVVLVHVELASGFVARHRSLLLDNFQMQILGKRLNDHLFLDALSCLSNGRCSEDMPGHGRDDQLNAFFQDVAQGVCTISASLLS